MGRKRMCRTGASSCRSLAASSSSSLPAPTQKLPPLSQAAPQPPVLALPLSLASHTHTAHSSSSDYFSVLTRLLFTF
eukprot:3939409-Rhodomonas_salina.1